MGYGILSGPGTDHGPCESECEHRDCAGTRAMAAAPCKHCGEPIGYDTKFYDTRDRSEDSADRDINRGLVHALCEWEKNEAA